MAGFRAQLPIVKPGQRHT